MRSVFALLFIGVVLLTLSSSALAQRKSEKAVLPTDPKLLELHRDFVSKAEKLGDEYARKKDWEKSRVVFQEILKLVPQYKPAKDKLGVIVKNLSQANRKVFTVRADGDWQDTGVTLEVGSPVNFRAEGKWIFVFEGDAEGIQIPRELRAYRLGSLIGRIGEASDKNGKPFTIGKQHSMSASQSGRLFLKMHDAMNQNNKGSIKVEITGNFK